MEEMREEYPVQSKWGSLELRIWPFFVQYNQPDWDFADEILDKFVPDADLV